MIPKQWQEVWHVDYSFPNTKSTTQQPRTCGPSLRQWFRIVLIVAPGSHKDIGQFGQAVEDTIIVDRLSEGDDGWAEPSGVDRHRSEGIAEDVTKETALVSSFRCRHRPDLLPHGSHGLLRMRI